MVYNYTGMEAVKETILTIEVSTNKNNWKPLCHFCKFLLWSNYLCEFQVIIFKFFKYDFNNKSLFSRYVEKVHNNKQMILL